MTVKQIQHLLAYLGYYTMEVDGISGPGTEEAVRNFQKDFGGIAADGVAGADTQKALKHAVAYDMFKNEPTSDNWSDCPNFVRAEFACKCGCGFKDVSHTLVQQCQVVRNHFGKPLIISSSCRCATHNANVGGVYNSRHLKCADGTAHAVDFRVQGQSATTVLAYVNTLPKIKYAYAIDSSYVHMDIGS